MWLLGSLGDIDRSTTLNGSTVSAYLVELDLAARLEDARRRPKTNWKKGRDREKTGQRAATGPDGSTARTARPGNTQLARRGATTDKDGGEADEEEESLRWWSAGIVGLV